MVDEGLVERVEVHGAEGSLRTWGVIEGDPGRHPDDRQPAVWSCELWVPASGQWRRGAATLVLCSTWV